MRQSVQRTIEAVRPIVPRAQMFTMLQSLRHGEERAFFREKFRELEGVIAAMPQTYGQDGLGDEAVVHLHYFLGGMDWWVTEKDMEGGTAQAFGLVDLGHGPELGYISIDELARVRGMNLDLHWKPATLREVKAERYPAPKPAPQPAAKPEYSREMIVDPVAILLLRPANGVFH